ncbi:peroxiredoxin [Syncephalis fuscata]|nr:peroxiredoxin [Syncephalis fuscata]
MLCIGTIAPDFEADTTKGRLRFYDYIEGSWSILYAHPMDFTPVCTTELVAVALLAPEMQALNCKLMGISVDSVESHWEWIRDIEEIMQEGKFNCPVVGDSSCEVALLYDMLDQPRENGRRATPFEANFTLRSVYIIDPQKRIRATISYPASCGRNFDEVLRILTALQLEEQYNVHTPADWDFNEREEATKQLGEIKSDVVPYMRWAECPKKRDNIADF